MWFLRSKFIPWLTVKRAHAMRVRLRLVTRRSKPSAPPFHYGCGYQLVALHPSFRFRTKVQRVTMDDPIDVLQYYVHTVQYQSHNTLLPRTVHIPQTNGYDEWSMERKFSLCSSAGLTPSPCSHRTNNHLSVHSSGMNASSITCSQSPFVLSKV